MSHPIPTLHLRFVERDTGKWEMTGVNLNRQETQHQRKVIKVLQQFFEHPNGKEVCGDMFYQKLGTWRDVPLVEGV